MPLLVDPSLQKPTLLPWAGQAIGCKAAQQDERFPTPWALPTSLAWGESDNEEPVRLKEDLFLDFDPVTTGPA